MKFTLDLLQSQDLLCYSQDHFHVLSPIQVDKIVFAINLNWQYYYCSFGISACKYSWHHLHLFRNSFSLVKVYFWMEWLVLCLEASHLLKTQIIMVFFCFYTFATSKEKRIFFVFWVHQIFSQVKIKVVGHFILISYCWFTEGCCL